MGWLNIRSKWSENFAYLGHIPMQCMHFQLDTKSDFKIENCMKFCVSARKSYFSTFSLEQTLIFVGILDTFCTQKKLMINDTIYPFSMKLPLIDLKMTR